MLVLGVDIGARGAVAVLDAATGELVGVHDMPVLGDGPKGRAAVNAPLLADLVYGAHAGHASVEFVGARPARGRPARLPLAGAVASSRAFAPLWGFL